MRELNNSMKALMLLVLLVTFSISKAQTPIWEDNFDGTAINKDVWTYDVKGDGMGNGELEYYTDRAANSYISNGNLVIEAKREDFGGKQFTSARLKTLGRFSFKYGTIEARIKLPNLQNGLWPAFWTMGDNIGQVGWPKCGEIDILEAGSEAARLAGKINSQMSGALHWWHETGTWSTWLQADASAVANLPSGNFYDDYHTYKMVWDASHIEFWLDNNMYFNMDITAPELSEFRQPHFILLNLAVGGTNYVNLTDPAQITAPLPGKMLVDYVRIYPIAGQTQIYKATDAVKSGNYGVFTDNTACTEKLNIGTDADLYLWNNMTAGTGAAYEGANVLNYNIAAANWWGMGIMARNIKNMSKYSDGYLHLRMKTSSTETIGIGVGSAAGESFIDLANGGNQYGLVRDGQWHEVMVPLNKFAIDFNSVYHFLEMKGAAPAAAFSFSVDDIYWVQGAARVAPENGNFGVYTDNTACVMKFNTPADGDFFVWEKTLNPIITTPKEGANVLSFTSAPGLAWFGAAFTPNAKYNLTAFRYATSKLHFDMKTSSTATFKIGIKSSNTPEVGQGWVTFKNGADPYGFVRNGAWQSVDIPMSAFDNVDLSQVSQLFEILGTEGAISDIAIDNIYYTGGGTAIKDGTSTVSVTGVTVTPTTASINVGATTQLTATVAPSNATNKTVSWSTSNASVATVSASGLVTAVAAGTATITVTTQDGGKIATCAVTVTNPTIAVTGVTVSPATASVTVGGTSQLTATVAPSNATNKTVTWSSSNTAIATVSASGLVTGVAAGSATITVRTNDGGKTATCAVTVSNTTVAVTGVTLSPTTASIAVGATSQLTATVAPSNATNKTVTWSSSNTAIATVSASGLVTGVAAGSATITVRTNDGAKTATCAVTVTANNGTNIALNKPVTVSSTENAGTPGSSAVDGNAGTRWSSAASDPQWIVVDLQGTYNITKVVLNWETAAGKSYQVQVSSDNANWTNMYTTTTGAAGIATLNVTGTGRYVRVYGTVRTTTWGYSLWELEVYGTPSNNVAVTGVTVSPTTATVAVNATTQLTATVAPSNATNKNVTWASSNTAVATVSTTGLVTGKAAGTATITVTTQDGAKTATCTITVPTSTIAVTGVTVAPTSVSLGINATSQLNATVAPSNATNKSVTWTSSNTAVATVSTTGLVTAKTAGTATITVKTTDGAKTATCAVTVTNNTTNIALNKPATSSSNEAAFTANAAVDGNAGTRWSSTFADPQWITIDLQAVYSITQVILKWEAASGKNYTIQVSNDNTNWTTIKTVTNGVGGTETYAVSGSGRYIRMYGTARNTAYGYSLWEFEVYGSAALMKAQITTEVAQSTENTFEAYPVPMKNDLNLKFSADTYQKILIVDMTGKIVYSGRIESGVENENINVSNLHRGSYYVRLIGENASTAKLVIK